MAELDDALDSYLDTLDLYSLATARLNQNLKTGFFDLAKAKQVLGHARVDQASLAQTTPSIAVSIEEDSSFLIIPFSAAPPPPSPALPTSQSLRNRINNPLPPSSPTDSSPPPPPSEATPLDRISALPPAALRSAQSAFESALKSAVEVVSIVQELGRLEGEVRGAREDEKERIIGGGGGGKKGEEGASAPMKCDDLD
ncbi:hypothetical protein RQP46_005283 [Phenoliferia psychrophenolica]